MNSFANKFHIKGMTVLLADKCMSKHNNIHGYVSHNHPYISNSAKQPFSSTLWLLFMHFASK